MSAYLVFLGFLIKIYMSSYHPESYWSTVAKRIDSRPDHNVVAGDDSPYYRYKRQKFLSLLLSLDWNNKRVLELGSGPGGNLKELLKENTATLQGADISNDMIALATKNIANDKVVLTKINGENLPFDDNSQDVVFSATVLQHNTDDQMMRNILKEMCRVSANQVILFERIENNLKGDDLCMGRPVDYYASICKEAGFELESSKFINIQTSYLVSGLIRKVFNLRNREEGQQLSGISIFLQNITLPFTRILDNIFTSNRDLGRLVFKKKI